MTWMTRHTRWIAVVVLATVLVAGVAPVADADSRKKRWKKGRQVHTRVVYRDHHPSSTYIVRRSSAGPAIAGFLGGLFLGAALAHAAPAGYAYHDPYCGTRFTSLEVYRTHFHRHRHPGVIRVVALDRGDYLRTYRYANGDWRAWDDDGRHRHGEWCEDEHRAWARDRDRDDDRWERDRDRDDRWERD
jgi:hypothetical protein